MRPGRSATPALTTHFEPYVSVEKAAEYLDIAPKTLLEKARKGEVPAYPWGNGIRKISRFKISQLDSGWKESYTGIAARLFLKGKGLNEKEAYE